MKLLAGQLVYFYAGWIVCSVASKTNLRRLLDPGPGEAVGNSSVRLIPQLDESSGARYSLTMWTRGSRGSKNLIRAAPQTQTQAQAQAARTT
jgi:hypothetical protein